MLSCHSVCIFLCLVAFFCMFVWLPLSFCLFAWLPIYSCLFVWLPISSCLFVWLPISFTCLSGCLFVFACLSGCLFLLACLSGCLFLLLVCLVAYLFLLVCLVAYFFLLVLSLSLFVIYFASSPCFYMYLFSNQCLFWSGAYKEILPIGGGVKFANNISKLPLPPERVNIRQIVFLFHFLGGGGRYPTWEGTGGGGGKYLFTPYPLNTPCSSDPCPSYFLQFRVLNSTICVSISWVYLKFGSWYEVSILVLNNPGPHSSWKILQIFSTTEAITKGC